MKTRDWSCLYTYSLPSSLNEDFAHAKKVALLQVVLQSKDDTEPSGGFDRLEVGRGSRIHKSIMDSKGTELIQNLCNTQSNSLPFHIIKVMDSKKETNKQRKKPKHKMQTPKSPIYYKGRAAVEIKNFMSTRIIYSKECRKHSANKPFAKITLMSYHTKNEHRLLTTAKNKATY